MPRRGTKETHHQAPKAGKKPVFINPPPVITGTHYELSPALFSKVTQRLAAIGNDALVRELFELPVRHDYEGKPYLRSAEYSIRVERKRTVTECGVFKVHARSEAEAFEEAALLNLNEIDMEETGAEGISYEFFLFEG